jgi:CubicO group peptidase (beta-lactamase class C family)
MESAMFKQMVAPTRGILRTLTRAAVPPASAAVALSIALGFPAPALSLEEARTSQTETRATEPSLTERLASIEDIIEHLRVQSDVAGASLGIVKDGRVVLLKGFGMRDIEKRLAVTPDTLFPVGSISKSFTALAVLLAMDSNALSLDDPPRKFLPEFKLRDGEADARVTLRDLLAHRTGVERADLAWTAFQLSRNELIRGIATLKQVAKMGSAFHYNNYLYVAAGEAAARAMGQTYEDLVTKRLLQPLGMRRTNFSVDLSKADPDHALGYAPSSSTPQPMPAIAAIAPAGGVISTSREMIEFVRFLIAGQTRNGQAILSSAALRNMTTPQIKVEDGVDYGLGLFLRNWKGLKVIEHEGNLPGYSALIAAIPERSIGFVLLTNASNSPMDSGAVMTAIWTRLLEPSLPTDASAQNTPPARDSIEEAGHYVVPGGGDFVVVPDGEQLMLKVPGQPDYPLVRLGTHRYRLGGSAPAGLVATFRQASFDPAATELFLRQPQGNIVLPKRASAPLDAQSAAYADLIGVYQSRHVPLKVEIDNLFGRISLVIPGQPAYPLIPKDSDVYVLSGLEPAGAFVLKVLRREGTVSGLVVQEPNGRFEFARLTLSMTDMTAEQLRKLVVDAIGGEGALLEKRTLVGEFGAEVLGTGLSGRGKMYWKAPHLQAYEMTLQVLGQDQGNTIRSVFDGANVQFTTDGVPKKTSDPAEVDWAIFGSIHEPLAWNVLYKEVFILGKTYFDGKECYAVRLSRSSGRQFTAYYDAATHLPTGVTGLRSAGPDTHTEVETTLFWRDWVKVENVMFPATQIEERAGIRTVLRFNRLAWNEVIEKAQFEVK